MSSISEDNGEETPLQVLYLNVDFFTAFVSSISLLSYTRSHDHVGTFKWCCHFHWYSWTLCCCCRFGCVVGKVTS